MLAFPTTLAVPLHPDEHGGIRVSGTRVTPEMIRESFSTVPLNDIYAVIADYPSNHDQVEAYFQRHEQEAAEIRAKLEARLTPEQ